MSTTHRGARLLVGDAVLERIAGRVETFPSMRAAARRWGVSAPYLSDVLLRRRAPGPKILRHFGIRVERRVTTTYTYWEDAGTERPLAVAADMAGMGERQALRGGALWVGEPHGVERTGRA